MKRRRTATSPSQAAPPLGPAGEADASPNAGPAVSRKVRRGIVVGIVALAMAVRVFVLVAWCDKPIPVETSVVMAQAGELRIALDPAGLEPLAGEEGECRTHVSRWFCGYRTPPLFSGLIGLAVRASECVVPYREVYDPDGEMDRPIAGITEMQRMWRLRAAAYVLAFLGGLWLLRPAWLILRRCGNESAALAGLAFIAVLPCAVEASARPLADTVFAGLFLYAVAMLLGGVIERSFDAIVNSGLLIGVAFLTRAEALLLLPIGVLLLIVAAIVKRMAWGWAIGTAVLFLLAAAVLAGPYVKVVSENQKQFTIGRNAGDEFLHEIGLLKAARAPDEGPAAAEAADTRVHQAVRQWPSYFVKNLFDRASRMLGYAGMLFVVTGLFFCWRSFFRWSVWPLATLVFVLLAAMLAVFPPSERLLLPPVLLLSPPMGLGAAMLAAELVSRRSSQGPPGSPRAIAWIVGACVMTVLAATVVGVISG